MAYVVFTDKAKKYIPRLMKDLSLKHYQACGIFGNLGTETGGFTALQEKKPTVVGSKGGYGWMQWTGPRRRAYEAYCTKYGLNKADDEVNYGYLIYETQGPEKASLAALKQTKTLAEATESFMKKNLRPGIPHLDNRQRWASRAYEATKGLNISVAPKPPAPKGQPKTSRKINLSLSSVGAFLSSILAVFSDPTVQIVALLLIAGFAAWFIYSWKKKHADNTGDASILDALSDEVPVEPAASSGDGSVSGVGEDGRGEDEGEVRSAVDDDSSGVSGPEPSKS